MKPWLKALLMTGQGGTSSESRLSLSLSLDRSLHSVSLSLSIYIYIYIFFFFFLSFSLYLALSISLSLLLSPPPTCYSKITVGEEQAQEKTRVRIKEQRLLKFTPSLSRIGTCMGIQFILLHLEPCCKTILGLPFPSPQTISLVTSFSSAFFQVTV